MTVLTNKYIDHTVIHTVIILDDYIYCGCKKFQVSELDTFIAEYNPSKELINEGWAKYTGELTSFETYQELSKHENVDVRIAVAKHFNTPVEILKVLSTDDNYKVRLAVASNPNTPKDVLNVLSMDAYSWVRASVSRNPNFCKVL